MRRHLQKNKGFSLVEMSVVLVIIGLIMAAVLQGGNMIESARIRSVISEFSDHAVSVSSFKSKYNQYPGDFKDAVSFWGATTANGDGNGKVDFTNGSGVYEGYRLWQHLSYAKMTKGLYPGTATTGAVVDTDIPKSKLLGGYVVEYGILNLTNNNVIALGVPTTTISLKGSLKPKQAFEIDSKIDDGNPSYGSVRSIDGNGSTAGSCVNDVVPSGPNKEDFYQISASGLDCVLGIKI